MEIKHFSTACRQRQDAIGLARQFVQLIKAVQRHRGVSMALLAGDASFTEQFNNLEKELERRLTCLLAFATDTGLISAADRENLGNAWLTLSRDWEQDDVIDNFELHSHVLEQLLAMLAALAKQMEKPVSVRMGAPQSEPARREELAHILKQVEVLNFVTLQVPQMVEQIARIRGLATYALTSGINSEPHTQLIELKLRYAIQRVSSQCEQLRLYAERLEGILNNGLVALGPLKKHEIRLMFLLNRVEMSVFGGGRAAVTGRQIFTLATDLIEVYLKVVDEGLHLVSRWHEQDLDAWLNTGGRTSPF